MVKTGMLKWCCAAPLGFLASEILVFNIIYIYKLCLDTPGILKPALQSSARFVNVPEAVTAETGDVLQSVPTIVSLGTL